MLIETARGLLRKLTENYYQISNENIIMKACFKKCRPYVGRTNGRNCRIMKENVERVPEK